MSSVRAPGTSAATSAASTTPVSIPIRLLDRDVGADLGGELPAGSRCMKPVRTNPQSPAPTSSAHASKYGNDAQASRASLSRS